MFALRSIALACRTGARLSHGLSLAAALLLAASTLPAAAQTALKAGDVAVVALRSDTPDSLSIVLLRDVEANTEIRITDNGWKAADAGWRNNEGVWVWKTTAALKAGTVVHLSALDTTTPTAKPATATLTKVGTGSFNLAAGGDSVLLYQGTEAAPVFLFGMNNTAGAWEADASNANTSALPTGLTAGTSALALAKQNNQLYAKGVFSGTAAELLQAIATPGNWVADTSATPSEPGPFIITSASGADAAIFTPPAGTAVGSSDASAAIALDDTTMVVGDDEANVLRVYPRAGGAAIQEWDYGAALGLGKELDLEAGAQIGSRWFFIGSHGNKSDGSEADNREHLFAVDVAGTGAATRFAFVGQYAKLEGDLVAWDNGNQHGLGAKYLGLAASSAGGVLPEASNGFSIEGMAATASGQLLLGFRAPLTDTATRRKALVVPLTNPDALVNAGTAPAFGAPIELDLGGRGIRDMQRTGDGKYLIIAGPPGKADASVAANFALFVWAGPGTTAVVQLDNALDALLAETKGSFETLVSPSSTAAGTRVQLLQDNGDTVWPGKTKVSKDLPAAEQQFKGNWIVLGNPVAADTAPPQLQSTVPANNAVQVGKNTAISLRFDEAIAKGQGSITLQEVGGAAVVLPIGDAQISVSGAELQIKPRQAWAPGKRYEVQVPAGAVQDSAGNPAAAQTLAFTISEATAATAQVLITEVNSNAAGGDFFELYNYGTGEVDLSGWTWTDSSAKDYGSFAGTTRLAPGARLVVVADKPAADLQKAWGLSSTSPVIAVTGPGLGKGDAVVVYDANGFLVSGMNYGAATLTALDGSKVLPARKTDGTAVTATDHAGVVFGGTGAGVSAVWDGQSTSDVRYTAAKVGELEAFAQPGDAANIGSPGKLHDDTQPPAGATTRISAVQGAGAVSPLLGQSVTVRGVVTAYLPGLQGFFIQSLPEDDDGKAETSEGVFAYLGSTAVPDMSTATVGKVVQFTGTVSEYKEQTQIGSISNFKLLGTAAAMPAAVPLQLPIADMALWERYEGMRVRISSANGPLVVTDNYTLGRYGTLTLSSDALLPQYTELHAPSVAGNQAYIAEVLRKQIILDDGSSKSNPSSVLGRNGQPLSASNTLRAGDATTAVIEGVLDQFVDTTAGAHQTSYRLQPSSAVAFSGAERPTVQSLQQAVGEATVKVASANVLNFFTTLGKTKFSTPLGDVHEGRGADNEAELARQRDKLVAMLLGLQADVLGLMEVQNNGFGEGSAIAALVAALNQAGSAQYDYVRGPYSIGADKTVVAAGRDAISVAVVYRKDKLTPVGKAAAPDEAQYDAFDAHYGNRVPVAQSFELALADGSKEQFTVVVNHLKSKGSVNDPDIGDGQGANNQARLRAVNQLHSWLGTRPTQVSTDKTLLLGDFNAYAKEDPITYLEGKGYQKLAPGQMSYGFQGLWGALDHVLVSPALIGKVGNAVKWRINAEEPPALDYNTNFKSAEQVQSFYAADSYRSSDHNPIVVGLKLDKKPVDPEVKEEHSVTLPSGQALQLRFTSSAGCKLDAPPTLVNPAALGALPKDLVLPHQALQWSASGCAPGGALKLDVTYPAALPANAQYWKWGPTAANTQPHWYALPAMISGAVLSVQLADGADGDDDLQANGKIADPGGAGWVANGPVGPVTGQPTPVPGLNTAGLLGLSGLLAMATAWLRRRKPR